MSLLHKLACTVAATALLLGSLALTGCGTPAAPQPPSLNLPEPVQDLTGERIGDVVTLHWTMPKKTTDHELLKGPVKAQIWRSSLSGKGNTLAGSISVAPAATGTFSESLPSDLTSGNFRPLLYSVELLGKHGRSAGRSEPAGVLAGPAPAPFDQLTAEVRADGVALRWKDEKPVQVRLHRRLLSAAPKQKSSLNNPPAGPTEVTLLAQARNQGEGIGALDPTARFGQTYEYTAQGIEALAMINTGDPSKSRAYQLAGIASPPIRVDVVDTFPPAVPQGLVTVWVAEEKTIDLSWQPDTDDDLAGYIVYRAEGDSAWKRISPLTPLIPAAFRDSSVQPGHSYRYAVTAIDLTGNESKRSAEAAETVPNP
jgi:hypothetical protein